MRAVTNELDMDACVCEVYMRAHYMTDQSVTISINT